MVAKLRQIALKVRDFARFRVVVPGRNEIFRILCRADYSKILKNERWIFSEVIFLQIDIFGSIIKKKKSFRIITFLTLDILVVLFGSLNRSD